MQNTSAKAATELQQMRKTYAPQKNSKPFFLFLGRARIIQRVYRQIRLHRIYKKQEQTANTLHL